MEEIIFPLANILNSMVIFLLYSFKIGIVPLILVGYFLKLIIKQCQFMIKLKIQLLKSLMSNTFLFVLILLNFNLNFFLIMIFPMDDS